MTTFEAITQTPTTRKAFGALVRNARWKLDMDQHQLAEQAECLPHQVQAAEVGVCFLPGVLRRIGEVLGIEPGKVIG